MALLGCFPTKKVESCRLQRTGAPFLCLGQNSLVRDTSRPPGMILDAKATKYDKAVFPPFSLSLCLFSHVQSESEVAESPCSV